LFRDREQASQEDGEKIAAMQESAWDFLRTQITRLWRSGSGIIAIFAPKFRPAGKSITSCHQFPFLQLVFVGFFSLFPAVTRWARHFFVDPLLMGLNLPERKKAAKKVALYACHLR